MGQIIRINETAAAPDGITPLGGLLLAVVIGAGLWATIGWLVVGSVLL